MDGAELRRRRLALGLNQSQLARLLGVPVQTLTRWESARMPIRHALILDYALRWMVHERSGALRALAEELQEE